MEAVNRFFESHKLTGFILLILLAGLLTALMTLLSELVLTTSPVFSEPIDHHKYIFMAQHPFGFFIAPFCWRVGMPLLAGLLPFDLQTSFLAITILSVVFSGVILFYLLKRLGFSYAFSLTGMLLFFAAGWIVRVTLINFWVPNGMILLIILGCLYMLASGNDIGFMLLLALGVLVKESAIFVAPLTYTFRCRNLVDWRAARKTILLALPAAAILILLRVFLPAQNGNPLYTVTLPFTLTQVQQGTVEYDYISLLKTVALSRLTDLSPRGLMDYSLYPFGAILCILPFFAIRENLKWLARLWPYLLLVFSQLLFAVSTIKLIYLALPVLIVLALTGLRAICSRLSIPLGFLLVLPAVTYALNLTKANDNADFKWLALLLLVWLGLAYALNRLPRKLWIKNAA